jgi:hypothetical protein
MMTLKRFEELGIRLWVEGDQLKVSGLSSIPEGDKEEVRRHIRDHKAEIISQLRPKFQIQQMTRCLHDRPCDFLCSAPPMRPFCAISGEAIFDMDRCPKGLWR